MGKEGLGNKNYKRGMFGKRVGASQKGLPHEQ